MRIFVNTRVIHLEELPLLALYDTKNWLINDIRKHPEHLETNKNKIVLVNKEIAQRDLLPLTPRQKKRTSATLERFK